MNKKYIIVFLILIIIVIFLFAFTILGIFKKEEIREKIVVDISESDKEDIENICFIFARLLLEYEIDDSNKNIFLKYYDNLNFFTKTDVSKKDLYIFSEYSKAYERIIVQDDWGYYQKSRLFSVEIENIDKKDENYFVNTKTSRIYQDPVEFEGKIYDDILKINFIKENDIFLIEDFDLENKRTY